MKRQPPTYEVLLVSFLIVWNAPEGHCARNVLFNVAERFSPGAPLHVALTLPSDSPQVTLVRASLMALANDTSEIVAAEASIEPGDTQLLKLQVPWILPMSEQYSFLVYSVIGEPFAHFRKIKVESKYSSTCVQTDRKMYKPGQRVLFRVIHLRKGLIPSKEPLTVTIVNPADIKVEMYPNVTSENGVSSFEFQLPDFTTSGKWSIVVEKEDDGSKAQRHVEQFTVEEFVSPTFEVDVRADPGYIVLDSQQTPPSIIVKASYTFGKGVQGVCRLIIEQQDQTLSVSLEEELSESGVVEFPSTVLSSMKSKSDLTLTAVVTDVTGRTENSSMVVKSFLHNARIQFLDRTTRILKPGLPALVAIRLTDQQGRPLGSDNPIKVEIRGPTIQRLERYLVVPAGKTEAFLKYIPIFQENIASSSQITAVMQLQPSVQATKSITLHNQEEQYAAMVVHMAENANLSVASEVDFEVYHILPKGISNATYFYMVVNQENIMRAGRINASTIRLPITKELCPVSTIYVGMAYKEQLETWFEVDRLKFKPTNCFGTKVNVSFESYVARTGTKMKMDVSVRDWQTKEPNSGIYDIFYMAVDKRTSILQGGTALSIDTLKSAMNSFPNKDGDATVNMIGNTGKSKSSKMYGRRSLVHEKEEEEEETGSQIRKTFPDTWLWGHAMTEPSGKLVKTVKLPDSITSWEVSAFAVSESGILVTTEPTQLTAFRRFFLTMNLLYCVKRSEVFQLKVTVFNYKTSKVQAIVAIHESDEFVVLGGINKDGWYETATSIEADRASTVNFRIGAVKAGLIRFKAKATDQLDGDYDEVHRNLLIKHDGVERVGLITEIMVASEETNDITKTFDIPWPEEGISSGSQRVEVKVTGELFGQALPNLDSLVVLPTGCGEQTMMKMAPNVYGLTYIQAKKLIDFETIVKSMKTNMQIGYIRQISKFLHSDGSFSVWGPSNNKPGSTWLTAFVIKCFTRAAEFITVDAKLIDQSITFLKKRQLDSGEFTEQGIIVHQEFLPSKKASAVALTSYVLISILETSLRHRGKVQSMIDKAIQFVLTEVDIGDPETNQLTMAYTAYALSLTELDDERRAVLEKLVYYVYDLTEGQSSSTRVTPKELEVAAYVLLTLIQLGRMEQGFKLMKWLNSQQNHKGGFKSTQDTVMVLQALAEFGLAYETVTGDGRATIQELVGQSRNMTFTLDISGPRAALLQTVELSSETKQVQITVSGMINVLALIKIVYFYHEVSQESAKLEMLQDTTLNINTTSERESRTIQKIQTCVQSFSQAGQTLENGAQGMYVTTLFLPSGEEAFESPKAIQAQNPATTLVETTEGNIHFYLPEAPTTPQCLVARVERQLEFEVQKPGYARVYPYYNPDLMNETTLEVAPLPISNQVCRKDRCTMDNQKGGATVYNVTGTLLAVSASVLSTLLLCKYA
ncbi:hypothetical protein RRG08_028802 [Elysia crispata]|uniref:CD109 antigen n=1 Tax=Elysia crispata TaxID=231223 RepID=A0AAE1CLW6_9GAST|nr:hypothetical protein RRG08_028802 [Elysia crispata]